MSKSDIPTLRTGFFPGDDQTKQIVDNLWSKIDGRKRNGQDKALHVDLISSCLSLRWVDQFSITAKSLTPAERDAVSNILAAHRGTFLRRTTGKSRYQVNPSLPKTLVVDQSEPNIRLMLGNNSVRYQNTLSIPNHPDAVSLIAGRTAWFVELVDVANGIQMLTQGQPLPLRWFNLPEQEITEQTAILVNQMKDHLRHWLPKLGFPGVLIETDDLQTIPFFIEQSQAGSFASSYLRVQLRQFFKTWGLETIVFPSRIHMRKEGRVETTQGFNLQVYHKKLAGVR